MGNAEGQKTGKLVVTYEEEGSANSAITQFDNQVLDGQVCQVKPFVMQGENKPRNTDSMLARRVYLMNIPYKTTDKLIESLVDEFAPVDKVVIPRDSRNGLARGYAF